MMSSEVKKDNFLCYDGIKAAVAIRSELLSLSFGSGVFCISCWTSMLFQLWNTAMWDLDLVNFKADTVVVCNLNSYKYVVTRNKDFLFQDILCLRLMC